MSTRKTVLGILGSLFALVGVGLLIAGGVVIWATATHRTSEGFISDTATGISTDTYALTSTHLDLGALRNDWLPASWLATVQVTASSPGEEPVFIGIAPTDDVADYLEGVSHDEVIRISDNDVTYQRHEGDVSAALPSEQEIWITSSEGSGTQSVEWDIEPGQWTVLIMNADASPKVEVEISAGVRTPWLMLAVAILIVGGLFCAVVGAIMLYSAFRPSAAVGVGDVVPATVPRASVPAGTEHD